MDHRTRPVAPSFHHIDGNHYQFVNSFSLLVCLSSSLIRLVSSTSSRFTSFILFLVLSLNSLCPFHLGTVFFLYTLLYLSAVAVVGGSHLFFSYTLVILILLTAARGASSFNRALPRISFGSVLKTWSATRYLFLDPSPLFFS